MQAAEPGEFSVGEAGDGAEDADLFRMLQLGLKTDHVEQRAELVVLAQLHDGVGLYRRPMRVGEAERLHRTVSQGFAATFRHHFDRQAAVEIRRRRLEIAEADFLAGEKRIDEGVVLVVRQRAIDVIGA